MQFSSSRPPSKDDSQVLFKVSALVVESLAYDLILGHDFMKHFGLDIRYSDSPMRIIGNYPKNEAPRTAWFVEHPLHPDNLSIKAKSYAGSAGTLARFSIPGMMAGLVEFDFPFDAWELVRPKSVLLVSAASSSVIACEAAYTNERAEPLHGDGLSVPPYAHRCSQEVQLGGNVIPVVGNELEYMWLCPSTRFAVICKA
ncbi:hypothetical protein FOL47_003207 [Perkinsus chesapeaki]|uniref:Uncharacterized protein n=1 Tax=Perkinsus chesapeaki TaxID=330153 RepID=A0A7J6KMC7_PERCH|nr:hypothetical protein FOL47_003207 [Perkinsus chesapeaki]